MAIPMGRRSGQRRRRASPSNSTTTGGNPMKKRRAGRPRRRPPTPAPDSVAGIAADLGNNGLIMVLFETPSGFAIFYCDGVQLYLPDAINNIWTHFAWHQRAKDFMWLQEFQFFKDKYDAINVDTGLNDQLTKMLQKWQRPGQKLAVGKLQYKTVIEARLGIHCLFDESVMEVMWGLKNVMHSLVPQEKSELAEEDCLQMSKGLKLLLDRFGFDFKPEMVNKYIVEAACMLSDFKFCVEKHSKNLRLASEHLEEVSCIDAKDWDVMKIATALKIACYPEEEIVFSNLKEMFSTAELTTLLADAVQGKYEGKIFKSTVLRVYKELVFIHEVGYEQIRRLNFWLEKISGSI
ncbi:hypothetical protein ACP70R_003134 [Stipagrostis hirtigluma subsp. patula]